MESRVAFDLRHTSIVRTTQRTPHSLCIQPTGHPDSSSHIMAETATAPAATPTTNTPAAPANGATAGAPNAPADQNVNSRGLPYYEKLRRDLRDTIGKKRLMDKSMVSDKTCLAPSSKTINRELIEAHHISTVIANRDSFCSE